MTIARASIIAFMNKAWECSEASTSTVFDAAIQAALDDISKLPIIRALDASQTLAVDGTTINHPTGLLSGGLISIVLMDAAGNYHDPLEPFPGGLREYRCHKGWNGTPSTPRHYIEGEGNKWYVWPAANAAYTVTLEYYRTHPEDVSTILLPDPCSLALKTGAVYWEAVLRSNQKYQAEWEPKYSRQLEILHGMYPGEPFGVFP
jgi:hypothetical protein